MSWSVAPIPSGSTQRSSSITMPFEPATAKATATATAASGSRQRAWLMKPSTSSGTVDATMPAMAELHDSPRSDRATTGFSSRPMPSTSTTTTCPGSSGPTPIGVPVAIRIAWIQGHHVRHEAQEGRHIEDHVCSVAVLTEDSIYEAANPRVERVDVRHHRRARRTERIEALRTGKHAIRLLKITSCDVVHRGVSRHVFECVGRTDTRHCPTDDHAELGLVVNTRGPRWNLNGFPGPISAVGGIKNIFG